MPELILKVGRFCENHVEKIVLVVAGVVSAWLFFTRVIFSPNGVPFDNRTFAPGEIDRYIYEEKAPELRAKLQRKGGKGGRTYASKLTSPIDPNDPIIADVIDRPLPDGLAGLLESPLAFIETVSVPKPRPASRTTAQAGRRYRLPLIPDVTDVAANHIRAAAYVPLQEVTLQNTYEKVAVEPNDIDLVTVEGRFDTAELYRRYQASFAGVDVLKEEWRDPCLADPIFAAVQLERQQQQPDGSWSDWRQVPRSRIEANREMFKPIDRVQDLPPGGLEVRLMQFDPPTVTMGLLQPESYQIASAEEDWFPPSFYSRYKELQRRVEQEEKREQREQSRQDDRTDTRQSTTRGGAYGTGGLGGGVTGGRAGRAGGGRIGTQDPAYGGGTRGGRGGRLGTQTVPGTDQYGGTGRGRSTRRGPGASDPMYGDIGYDMISAADLKRKPTTDEVYFDLSQELIRYNTDLSKRDKPVLFWVFDDTAGPGNTYRYRVRLGVFNPVAGSNQLVDQDTGKKDQVILWSRFSEMTRPIDIPKRIYLFAKSVQDRTKTATVEVARYTLGYWRTEDFEVKPGEAIGKKVEPKPDEREKERERARLLAQTGGRISDPRAGLLAPMGVYGGYMGGPNPEQEHMPKTVNYTTGKVLVDLIEVSDWGSAPNLRPRMYYDMLYTGDGTTIEHMPVSMTNWPSDLVRTYGDIQSDKRREPKPFRAFNKSGIRGRGTQIPGMEGYDDMGIGGYEGMYDMGGMTPY